MSIRTVPVELANHSYDVMIGANIIHQCGQWIKPFTPRGRSFIVTDTTVAGHYLAPLKNALSASEIIADEMILTPGEKTKNMDSLGHVMSALIDAKIERTDAIIALGGGVIGDLVGFAASILRRGTNFIQVPTTLLAQVDSSVGGKTAINMPQGKNLVGAFHQPVLVLADTDCLSTLPARELRAGYAEVIKYGLINDPGFFAWCENNGAALLSGDVAARTFAIEASVKAKAAIVAQDPNETTGIRALLNLGHTFGHALEAELKYSDRLLHGEAVGIGMQLAFDYSVSQGICPHQDAERLRAHLAVAGMMSDYHSLTNASGAHLVAHMQQDKKRQSGTLPFLLARGIGQTYLDKTVNLDDIEAFLDRKAR
jgi:3-dehydroquinate synthase